MDLPERLGQLLIKAGKSISRWLDPEALSSNELQSISIGKSQIRVGDSVELKLLHEHHAAHVIRRTLGWESPEPSGMRSSATTGNRQILRSTALAPEPASRWALVISKDCEKSLSRIDRKLQGKILEAILKISTEPMQEHGDTVKPLRGKLAGHWRYRIGDFRLIYHPQADKKTVDLISFAARGTVYK